MSTRFLAVDSSDEASVVRGATIWRSMIAI